MMMSDRPCRAGECTPSMMTCDDMVRLREIHTCKVREPDGYYYEPLWINPQEAEPRDIADGAVVTVYNERGAVLAGAWVTERIRLGAVYIDHGARWDPLEPGVLDRGRAINTITPHNLTSKNATGMVCSGFLVEVERGPTSTSCVRSIWKPSSGRTTPTRGSVRNERCLPLRPSADLDESD